MAATLCLRAEFARQILEGTKLVEIRLFAIPCNQWFLIYGPRKEAEACPLFCIKIGLVRLFESEVNLLEWLKSNEQARLGTGFTGFGGYFQSTRKLCLNFISAVARISGDSIGFPRGQGLRYFVDQNGEKCDQRFNVVDFSEIDLRWLEVLTVRCLQPRI